MEFKYKYMYIKLMGHAQEKQHKKQGFIYLEDVHGPFDHVCAPK